MRNFFAKLKVYEDERNKKTEEVLKKLINFIESASFTKSQVSKFICSHYKLGYEEMVIIWNNQHDTKKSCNTFRSQVSVLSRQLYEMFGGYENVVNAFEECQKEALNYISNVIDALLLGDSLVFSDIFISEVSDFAKSEADNKEFSISDCKKEIEILGLLKKAKVKSMLSKLDKRKLKYIQQTLNASLISSTNSCLNSEKLELLKKLNEF